MGKTNKEPEAVSKIYQLEMWQQIYKDKHGDVDFSVSMDHQSYMDRWAEKNDSLRKEEPNNNT